ncbi:MAG TPA: hypothetical protein PKW55_02825 [Spirochaetota bacterium]|nr:hypothetical protein [Spirochaetota bacterium]HOM38217.1 hypothetical protein [Spirochaetota bacterium]HPQ48565.1 hypothetical protein [Spirochaetota bacterium]
MSRIRFITFLLFIISVYTITSSYKLEVSEYSDENNLALNKDKKGYPSPLGTDKGWGGGSFVWEIVDGLRTYDNWAHGLAFCGGIKNWCSEPCGWREVLIDFGRMIEISKVVVWHHGLEHVPNTYKIQVLDINTGEYKTVFETKKGKNYLKFQVNPNPKNWWENFSTPTENNFKPVITNRLRYVINNCDIEHGWIYEIEVY